MTSKIVQADLHGVQGLDLTYLAGSFLLLAATMVLASAIPARRAARVDPITVLRRE